MSSAAERGPWHSAMTKWLASAIYASIKTMGARQAKVMSRAMSLVFVRMAANDLRQRNVMQIEPSEDPLCALDQYRSAEAALSLAATEQTTFTANPDGQIDIAFAGCPYGALCNETLAGLLARGDFNKTSIPCIRIDTYSAALAVWNNSKRPYRLVQFAPGARCQGAILPPRGGRA